MTKLTIKWNKSIKRLKKYLKLKNQIKLKTIKTKKLTMNMSPKATKGQNTHWSSGNQYRIKASNNQHPNFAILQMEIIHRKAL